MASESKPNERESKGEDVEGGMSMVEVLEEEKLLEEDAKAVLGDSDDKNCTYPMGYVLRQAVYSCITCVPPPETPAGVCLACSYECHEGHDLVELYTKRNFRCDCGNSKFKDRNCQICPTKLATNSENKYNQNFVGNYCTCHRPYPDLDDSVEDEMIQCVVCEDWYHGRHIEAKIPDLYEEMICQGCMKKNEFLWSYASTNFTALTKDESGESVDGETIDQTNVDTKPGASTAPSRSEGTTCLLAELKQQNTKAKKGATFWPSGWRSRLCKCVKCKEQYDASSVLFLLENDDTVHAYEERGKKKYGTSSNYDQGMKALSTMDRMQQVEVLHGYNNMKDELKDYLKKFAENGKTVREEHIREFFSEMQARKKQRLDGGGGMQWGCR